MKSKEPSTRTGAWLQQKLNFSCLPIQEVLNAGKRGANSGSLRSRVGFSWPLSSQESAELKQPAVAEALEAESVASVVKDAASGTACSTDAASSSAAPASPTAAKLLPLELGFANVELVETNRWPRREIKITALDDVMTEASVAALFDFMEYALGLPEVSTGFVLSYDVTEIGRPALDVVSQIVYWSCDPSRQARWTQRCICWKIIVPSGTYFQLSRVLLTSLFYISPPTCSTFLLSEAFQPVRDAVCFGPEFRLADQLNRMLEPPRKPAPDSKVSNATPSTTEGSSNSSNEEDALPDEIDVGFALLKQGFDPAKKMGYFKILSKDGEQTEEGLVDMLDYMDAFAWSPNASKGFAITYDLRALRQPPMSMISRIAEWGGAPERKARWEKYNLVCKVVINGGLRYGFCKGILSTFFLVCPPVCRTYLLTDPDEPEESATVFEPSQPIEEKVKIGELDGQAEQRIPRPPRASRERG